MNTIIKKYSILFSITILIFTNLYSQSYEETINWIGSNTNGQEQVFFDYETKKLIVLSVRDNSIYAREIFAKDVISISIKYGKNGWNSVYLNFVSSGSIVKGYIINENFKIIGDISETNMYGLQLSIESNRELINSIKKAFIHLFKTIGYTVKDGDFF